MCHAMPFSARALKKIFSLTLILCGKKTNRNVLFRGVYSYRKRVRVITFFPSIFFRIVSEYYASLQKFLKESDAYKQLICVMQRMHFQIGVGVFNWQDKDDIVVKTN